MIEVAFFFLLLKIRLSDVSGSIATLNLSESSRAWSQDSVRNEMSILFQEL